METWYSVSLGDAMIASIESTAIERIFGQVFSAAGRPSEMAVFTRSETEGRLHCEVIAYFSPATKEVAEAFDADTCEKPSQVGLGLLAGDERSWSVLFPESDE
jgi:hypothetical protein